MTQRALPSDINSEGASVKTVSIGGGIELQQWKRFVHTRDTCQLFQLIPYSGHKRLGVTETDCKSDGTQINVNDYRDGRNTFNYSSPL